MARPLALLAAVSICKVCAMCSRLIYIMLLPPLRSGTHASGRKICEYSTKGDGEPAMQDKAETVAGATQAAYGCACIKEADKPKAEWKEMLACPAGYSPLDSDVNVCRVILGDSEQFSIGWIQTGKYKLSGYY